MSYPFTINHAVDRGESELVQSNTASLELLDPSAASSIEATSENDQIRAQNDLWVAWHQWQSHLYFLFGEAEPNGIGGHSIIQSPEIHDDRRMKRKSKPVVCRPCNKVFGRKQEYKRHMRGALVHGQQRERQCLFLGCLFKWKRPDKIKAHLKIEHKQSLAPDVLLKIDALRGQGLTEYLDGPFQNDNREAAFRSISSHAMLQTKHSPPQHISPAPTTFENPSPTPSQLDSGISSWWSSAKNRLTPTKEPLTAAEQKDAKKAEKDRKLSEDWPTTPESKYSNPALLSLATPPKISPKHASLSTPASPTPGSQGLPSSLPPSLAPSPLRSPDSRTASPSRSPSREPPLLYTQFNEQGTLDVPGTLLAIARRFEKLETWTVGHLRALEARMNDVERWLVDKENEKGPEGANTSEADNASSALEDPESVSEMRDKLLEMQGRIGELGREMAKFATSPTILFTTPSRVSAQAVSTAPPTNSSFAIDTQTSSSITVHSLSLSPNTPQASVSRISSFSDLRRRDSVSPPFVPPSAIRAEQPRSRLPYPTGDYTSPPGSVVIGQGALSPPQSPPATNSASVSPAAIVRSRRLGVR